MRVATGQQRKSSTSADDVDRLPEAIQHQHRLVESNVHTG
jgi:hypothetical protein